MRFLGVTETCDLASLYSRLVLAGHDVKVAIDCPQSRGVVAGIVPHCADWRDELPWLQSGSESGLILFEATSPGFGAMQDDLRKRGHLVVGGSGFGDRLENDREFGQQVLRERGLPTARTWEFVDDGEAQAFIDTKPGRYVLKFSGHDHSSHDNYVGQREDGEDVRAMLGARLATANEAALRFILMEHVTGVEVGVGAFFNGERFLKPACLDWEHKRFFPGDLGELTGEMGTVATFDRSNRMFERTLGKVEPLLRQAGHVGWVNLNTIVNERGIWPLEFTCRFGYPGFAVLEPLQDIEWGPLLHGIATRELTTLPYRSGFAVGVVLSTPPFPYTRLEIPEPVGLPILLPKPLNADDATHIHLGEVGKVGDRLVTAGIYGWTVVVTGTGPDILSAQIDAYNRVAKLTIPNARYRNDIGDRLIASDYATLESWGLLDD
jgi:phosphoribosylamine--glycine ligase